MIEDGAIPVKNATLSTRRLRDSRTMSRAHFFVPGPNLMFCNDAKIPFRPHSCDTDSKKETARLRKSCRSGLAYPTKYVPVPTAISSS
jgi:hypothetical protein